MKHFQIDSMIPLLESAPIGVVVVGEDGRILLVNERAELLFQYDRDEMLDQPLELLLPEGTHRRHRKYRHGYFANPHARPMGQGMDLAGRRKDGSTFPVEVGLSFTELEGLPVAVSFITDISARVQAAEALRRHAVELEEMVATRTMEIERRRQVAEGLHDVLAVLNTARPLEQILDLIIEQAYRLLEPDAAAVYRQNGGTAPPNILAYRSGDAAGISDSAADGPGDGPELFASSRFRSVLTVPLNVKGEVYGSICLYYRKSRTFHPEEKHVAVSFADQAALAIENSRLRDQVERSAVASERNRIARELHDAVTQTLFSTSMIAEVLPRIWDRDPAEGRRRLVELRELTRGALAEMRTLLLELRPSALASAELGDLLRQLAEATNGRARIPVELTVQGSHKLATDVKIAFYRIAQEALHNVAKHAKATSVTVTLELGEEEASLQVVDDGVGFDPSGADASRLGLGIMRERAEAVGGTLDVSSAPGGGTTVRLRWRRTENVLQDR